MACNEFVKTSENGHVGLTDFGNRARASAADDNWEGGISVAQSGDLGPAALHSHGSARDGSAPEWGSGGRRFKSARPDHISLGFPRIDLFPCRVWCRPGAVLGAAEQPIQLLADPLKRRRHQVSV